MIITNIVVQCIFIYIATIGFSVIFNVKPSELIYCGFVGVVCYFFYKLIMVYSANEFLGALIGTFAAVIISRRLAFTRKIPAAIYIIPAIIPLAPGGTVYLTMYNIVYGNYAQVLNCAFITFKIAGGIVIGMSVALSIPNRVFTVKISNKNRK